MPFTGPNLLDWISISRNTSYPRPSWNTVDALKEKKNLENPTRGCDSELNMHTLDLPGTSPGPSDEDGGRY